MKIIAATLSLAALAACATATAPTTAPEAPAMPAPDAASLSAIGIGVSDLAASHKFYTEVLGMQYLTKFNLSYMDEIVLRFPGGGSAVVLMEWTDGSDRTLGSNGIKLVVRSPDPAAMADAIKAAGGEIVRYPEAAPEVGGAIVGFAKDPDGYLLELLPLG